MTTTQAADLEQQLEAFRGELTGYSYRMLGSSFEAEDAVQETLIRAWRNIDSFEGRSALRSWLYSIATNVCLDMLKGRQRRARPIDLSPAQPADGPVPAPLTEAMWIEPMPDGKVFSIDGDPADLVESRESIRLAFVAALQLLPPKQRAVLIFREVLRWKAAEVAELLETTVQSVNSALQRARATLAEVDVSSADHLQPDDDKQRELLERYMAAFERYDIDSLTTLLHEDATSNMPPYELWFRGIDNIRYWMLGPGIDCKGSRLVPTVANGLPAFGQYRPDPNGGYAPWSLQVLEIKNGKVAGLNFFLETERLFPIFGLPSRLDA